MSTRTSNGEVIQKTRLFVLEGHSPQDVARAMIEGGSQKEPFYIFDTDEVFRRIQHFKHMMPRVKICYAMKSNDNDMMLRLAVSLGLGFDCASPGEINKIRNLNVSPLSIIYAMPTKTPEQMMYARKAGVRHTTFDNSYELKKIKQYWPDACLLLRIRVDGDSIYKLGEKFGCDFETEAVDLLEEAAALGLKVVGVAFHVGSCCKSKESHAVGLQRVKALFDHEAKAGRRMKIVDIGGGYLCDRIDRIDEVSVLINNALDEFFPDPSIQVIAEPGRYISDTSTTHYCSINNIKYTIKNNNPLNMFYINDGLFGTLRYMESFHTVEKFKRTNDIDDQEESYETILWGPSCDTTDRIMQDRVVRLPKCTPFDWLVFPIQGAYTFGFASFFSCLEKPLTRPVVSVELWDKIKHCSVFEGIAIVLNPDLAEPLPSTLPPEPSKNAVKDSVSSATALLT